MLIYCNEKGKAISITIRNFETSARFRDFSCIRYCSNSNQHGKMFNMKWGGGNRMDITKAPHAGKTTSAEDLPNFKSHC